MFSKLALLSVFLFALACDAQAQENASTDNYVPPPLFGTPKPLPPKEVPDTPKMPKLSLPANPESKIKAKPITSKIDTKKEVKSPVIPLKKPEHPKDKFTGKPVQAVPEEGTVEKNTVKIGAEPIDLIKKDKIKKDSAPSPKPSPQGIVKGPKTMPANKKENVDTEILFETQGESPPDLMDRLKTVEEKSQPEETITINPEYPVPDFKVTTEGNRKLNLTFTEAQTDLSPEQINTLNALILPALKKEKSTRLLLESFASPQDNSLSGDRRLALTRAMAVRNHITTKNISPNRLDIRSLGAQTDIQPIDRIEILLVN